MLVLIKEVFLVGLLGVAMFVVLNPEKDKKGKYNLKLSDYLSKVDYKLVYFFMCLFVLVYLMDINGTIAMLELIFVIMILGVVAPLFFVVILAILAVISPDAGIGSGFLVLLTYFLMPILLTVMILLVNTVSREI